MKIEPVIAREEIIALIEARERPLTESEKTENFYHVRVKGKLLWYPGSWLEEVETVGHAL